MVQVALADLARAFRQPADRAEDTAADEVSREDTGEQPEEEKDDYRYVDVPDRVARVLFRLCELLAGPRLHLFVQHLVEVVLQFQELLFVRFDVIIRGSGLFFVLVHQALAQGDVLTVEEIYAFSLLPTRRGVDQLVVTGLGLLELRPVFRELLPVLRVACLQVLRCVPAHLDQVYLHLLGGVAGGLLHVRYLIDGATYGALAKEDDKAGHEEDQDYYPEAQPQFARYRHAVPSCL